MIVSLRKNFFFARHTIQYFREKNNMCEKYPLHLALCYSLGHELHQLTRGKRGGQNRESGDGWQYGSSGGRGQGTQDRE